MPAEPTLTQGDAEQSSHLTPESMLDTDNHSEHRVLEAVWQGENVRVDRALAELNLVRSRSQATEFIAAGTVTLNGAVVQKPGVKVSAGAKLLVHAADHYVGRAAHKLVAGLNAFGVDPRNAVCLDVGASTGGFTQVLLERGAFRVIAVDVGHDQMAPVLQADERVHLFEGCNARDMQVGDLGLTDESLLPSIVVADLSFISLRLVLPAMVRVAASSAEFVLLVKPQFEVGRTGVKAGIVTDPVAAARAVEEVFACAAELGLGVEGIIASPIPGGFGNREFVVHFSAGGNLDVEMWHTQVLELATATIGTDN